MTPPIAETSGAPSAAGEKKVTNPYYTYGILYLSENFHRYEASKGPEYKKYRLAWAERPAALDAGEFPLNLNMEVTTRCNLACTFCSQPSLKEEQLGDLKWEHFTKVIDEGAKHKTPATNFNGLGEPLLVKRLPEMIRRAKDRGFIDIMFHTNGTIMTEEIAKRLIESGLDKIIFSVDSPDKKTYESMRLKSNFDRVTGNVRLFARVRERMHKTVPVIRTTMVMTDETSHQVADFIDMWKPIADQMTLQDLTWRTKQLEDGTWTNREDTAIHVDFDVIREESVKRKYSFACPYLFQSSYTFFNGDIIPCSNPNARKFMVMGNVEGQSMKEIWNGKPYQDIRKLHATGEWHKHPVCRDCEIPLIELYKAMRKDGVDLGKDMTPPEDLPVASNMKPAGLDAEDMLLQSQKTAPIPAPTPSIVPPPAPSGSSGCGKTECCHGETSVSAESNRGKSGNSAQGPAAALKAGRGKTQGPRP